MATPRQTRKTAFAAAAADYAQGVTDFMVLRLVKVLGAWRNNT